MAIGRISGPMLFSNLERQGVDLSIEGNLIYFDVNNLRIGVNTDLPQYDLHIEGVNGFTPTMFVNGNIVGSNITVNNAYTLTTTTGNVGEILSSTGNGYTYWGKAPTGIERKKFDYTIPNLAAGANIEFIMDIGVSSIVYALTVSRVCQVEVFATAAKNETNPYTFLATVDHLTDDGTVLLSDGSVIQQRQYSIFANQETPPLPRVYARVTNVDGIAGPLNLSMLYFSAVTDTRSGIYETNVVTSLPASGYTGQTVMLKSNKKVYVWYDSMWNQVA